MKTKLFLIIGLTLALVLIQNLVFLPWWSFAVLMLLAGVFLPLKSWRTPSFLIGFVSGFLSWILPQLYFEMVYTGEVMNLISDMLGLPYILLLILIGLIGGILAGLGFMSGTMLKRLRA